MVAGKTVNLLSVYSKSEQSDMTAADRKAVNRFIGGLKDAQKGKRS
jgi:hypothetical protein